MHRIIVIAGSVGSLKPLRQIVAALPASCTASVFIVSHIGDRHSLLPDLLIHDTVLPVMHASNDTVIEEGCIYIAPPDHHMRLTNGWIWLDHGPKVNLTRPAADPLFFSAAEAYGKHVVGIVLSGYDGDGAEGLAVVHARGGLALVQKPEDAIQPSMPLSAIMADHPDACLSVEDIAERVAAICALPLQPISLLS